MASNFESAMHSALESSTILHASVIAHSKSSSTPLYTHSFGHTHLSPTSPPMSSTSTVWAASMTKLSTAISVLQCVQRNLLSLDAPIGTYLSEYTSPTILTSFSPENKPELTPTTTPLTLRHLLTHSSGLGYEGMNPLLSQYRSQIQHLPVPDFQNTTINPSCVFPLVFEPGTSWTYGCGIEWAGQCVERVTGLRLEEYMQQHIWTPLGMKYTSFRPWERKDVKERLTQRPMRNPETGKLEDDTSGMFNWDTPAGDDYGGNGLYTCAEDYSKIVGSLIWDDGRLLDSEMVKELLRPQLSEQAKAVLNETIGHPIFGHVMAPGLSDEGATFDYALGGLVLMNAVEGQAGKGLVMWSGLPNSYWYIDRERGVAGVYVAQLCPYGDKPTIALFKEFMKAMYKEVEKQHP